MNFPRNAMSKALTLALAGMVGAGFTGAAMAASTASQDQADRATSSMNAPADRLPATRGQTGDTSSATSSQDVSNGASGSSGLSSSSDLTNGVSPSGNGMSNPSDLNNGVSANGNSNGTPVEVYRRQTTIYLVPDHPGAGATPGSTESSGTPSSSDNGAASPMSTRPQSSVDTHSSSASAGMQGKGSAASADQRFDNLVHNDVESPSSVIGPAGGLRSGDEGANSPGATADANASTNANTSTDTNANTNANTNADTNTNAAAPNDQNRLPAHREGAQTGKGSMQNGGLTGPSGTGSSTATSGNH